MRRTIVASRAASWAASWREVAVRGLLVLAVALARPARGDSWSARLEPSYSATSTETTGADGSKSESDQTQVRQVYRLSLSKRLWPLLQLSAGGTYDWALTDSVLDDRESDADTRRWTGYARLDAGSPVLSGSATYTRTGDESTVDTEGQGRVESPSVVRETYGASLAWRPGGGPTVDVLVSRKDDYDADRVEADRTTDLASLALVYRELEHLDLRGSLQYNDRVDRVVGVESRELTESGSVLWSDSFLARRVSASAGYSASRRDVETTSRRADAVAERQQLPFEGLSIVEGPVDSPTRVTLAVNRALIDGDVAASAGLDVGYGVRAPPSSDSRAREVGVQFADERTPVNIVHVHVDRSLPAEVWGAFTWRAFTSDDNVTWTEVAVNGAGVRFGRFENRFELPIARVEARYLKVVTTPLLTGVTIDPALSSIFLTEVRVYLTVPAAEVVGHDTDTNGALSASVRAALVRRYNLVYDGGLFVRHGGTESWNVLNGLSASRRLGAIAGWSARLDRTDSSDSAGHTALTRASASISADPLPTLGGALASSAQLVETPDGTGWSVSSSALGRADLYAGVSLAANAGAGVGENEISQRIRFGTVSTTATIVPLPEATLTGGYFLSASRTDGPGETGDWEHRWRAEGTILLVPFPALSLSAGVARSAERGRPSTLASFSANASPFPGGDLVVRFSYNETIDTGPDTQTRQWGPGLRLNIRPGSSFDAGYTFQTSSSPTQDTETTGFFANLVITLP